MKDTRPYTVLLAEDDDDMRAVLVEALERDGHAVVATRTGVAALTLLAATDGAWTRPSIVLSDLRMPGLDGLALAEEVHARTPSVPVILLTAFPSTEVLDRAHRVGVVAVFSKPFDLDLLRTAVLVFAEPRPSA